MLFASQFFLFAKLICFWFCFGKPLKLQIMEIKCSNEILPPGSTVPRPETAHIAFGAPLHLEDGEDTREFPGRLREAVLSLRTEPRPRPDRFRILARHVYRSVAHRISEFDS